MKVGEEYMWVVDGFAYPRRVVIKTEPDSRGYVKVRCYDNDGTSYIALADVTELRAVSIDISQKGDSMETIRPDKLHYNGIKGQKWGAIRYQNPIRPDDNPVSHPTHYTNGSIECIDAMKAAFGSEEVVSFCKLNAFKYIWRCKLKGKELEDIEKAGWYLEKAIELLKEEAQELHPLK